MKNWAIDELNTVGSEVNDLRANLKTLREAVAERDKRLASALGDLTRERKARTRDAEVISAAQAELTALSRSKKELEAKIASTTQRLTGRVFNESITESVRAQDGVANLSPAIGTGVAGTISAQGDRRSDAPAGK